MRKVYLLGSAVGAIAAVAVASPAMAQDMATQTKLNVKPNCRKRKASRAA